MADKIISIEVGYSLTKVAEMDFRSKNPKIYKYFTVPTPEGVLDDGFINENNAFFTAIKQGLSFHKMKTKQAVCTITSSKIATREVQLPSVKANQVQAMVEANASDYFPINLADYEIGHLVLGNVKDTDGTNKLRVMVMACSRLLIEDYDRLCNAVGLHLISLDYSGNSIYQVMKGETREETEMVIKVEDKVSIATIISGSNMIMQRNVVYGFENAVYAMINSVGFPQKNYKDAVEEMRRVQCINVALSDQTEIIAPGDDLGPVNEHLSQAMTEITAAMSPLIGNVSRVLDLYNSKYSDKPVTRITLIGSGSEIKGLAKLFANELHIKTSVCGNLKYVSWPHSQGNGNSGRYISTIGAAIAPVGFVNEEKKVNDIKEVNYKNVTILCAVLFALIAGALYFTSFTKLVSARAKQTSLLAQESLYSKAEVTYNRHNNTKALYDEVKAGYDMTDCENDNLIAFLESLEKTLPADSEITQLSSDNNQADITIVCDDIGTAGKIIQNIRDFDCAMDVVVNSIVEEEPDAEATEPSEEGEETEGEETEEETEEGEEEEDKLVDYRYKFNLTVIYWSSLEAAEGGQQ